MKATFDIDEKVVQQLYVAAARRGTTVDTLVEAAIRVFTSLAPTADGELKPLPSWPMGKPLVDISNRDELYDKLEDWDKFRQLYGNTAKE